MIEIDNKLINFANKIADESGKIIKHYFRTQKINQEKEYKEANSPIVTIADKECELKIRELIEKQYPQHSIIGEEYGEKIGDSIYKWVIDPIDGTIAFSTGKPIFGTIIGLLQNNKIILGIINQPILNERWMGIVNKNTFFNGAICKTKKNTDISKSSLCTTTPYMFDTEFSSKILDKLSKEVHIVSFGGDCYNYGLLACGYVDIVIERNLNIYDYVGLIPIIEQAGGICTDWMGNPFDGNYLNGDFLAVSNQELHNKIVDIIKNIK